MAIDVKRGIRRLLIVLSVAYWLVAAVSTASLCSTALRDQDAVSDAANRIWWAPKNIPPPPHGSYPAGASGEPDPAYVAIVTNLERDRAARIGLTALGKWAAIYISGAGAMVAVVWIWCGFKARPV